MKVLQIALNNQYRSYKQAQALRASGVDVDLVTLPINSNNSFLDAYKDKNIKANQYSIHGWKIADSIQLDSAELKCAIEHSKPDIIKVQNPPDYTTLDVKRACGKIPVVHDLADIYSLMTVNSTEVYNGCEHHALLASDGIINVSPLLEKYMLKAYPDLKGKPMTTMANYCLLNQIPEEKLQKKSENFFNKMFGWKQLVYSGSFFEKSYRNLAPLFDKFSQMKGLWINMYSNQPVKQRRYFDKKGFFKYHIHKAVPALQLTKELTQYDVGYVGFSDNTPNLIAALPNKFYEYYSAGIPICTQFIYEEMANFIKENKCGFTFSDEEDFMKGLDKWCGKTYKVRKENFMENQIPRLIKFYEEVISNGR